MHRWIIRLANGEPSVSYRRASGELSAWHRTSVSGEEPFTVHRLSFGAVIGAIPMPKPLSDLRISPMTTMAAHRLLNLTVLSILLHVCLISADWRARPTQTRTTLLSCDFTASQAKNTTCDTADQQVFKLLSVSSNKVLIGSTECLHILDTNLTYSRSTPITLDGSDKTNCEFAFPEAQKAFRCKNYITYAHETTLPSFRVCGTYSSVNPRCWTCMDDGTSINCDEGHRTEFMPRTPTQNFTILKAADGAQDYYYLGGLESYTSPENILAKVEVDLTAGVTSATVETDHNEEKVLKQPGNFAGSIERGEYIYFFFRERALEYENIGQIIYSRVARVCKNDEGGVTNPLSGEFTTFLKTRLMCSVGDEFPFIFNELQDVKQSENDANIVYGLFTTSSAGTSSTAICRYNMVEVEELFDQDFRRGQPSSTQLWQRISRNAEDTEARRTCTEAFPFGAYAHLEDYPLLNTNAPNCGLGQTCSDYTRKSHDALAVFEGIRGQQLAVFEETANELTVYVGTNNQTIYEAIIEPSVVRITKQFEITANPDSFTDAQKANKWPFGVSYLQVHNGQIYGTLDDCAFRFTPGFNEELQILDRSLPLPNLMHPNNIDGAVTHFFKLFEGPDGADMNATFSGGLEHYCSQKNFKSSGTGKREYLHVSCVINKPISGNIDGRITVSSEVGELPVSVDVKVDNTAVATSADMEEVNQYDQEMAKYRYKFQEWLGNVTCPDGNRQTCPSASSPTPSK